MMKNKKMCLMGILLGVIFLTGCKGESLGKEEKELLKLVKAQQEYGDAAECLSFYRDYDKDGEAECFFALGETYIDEALFLGDLWFASKSMGVSCVESGIFYEKGQILSTKDRDYLFLGCENTADNTYVYTVENKDAVGLLMETEGSAVFTEEGQIEACYTGAAAAFYPVSFGLEGGDPIPYYFYAENGKIKEYQAREIKEEQFLFFENADKALLMLKEEDLGTIENYLLRENNLLHCNLYQEADGVGQFSYATFRVEGQKILPETMTTGSGFYEEAITSESSFIKASALLQEDNSPAERAVRSAGQYEEEVSLEYYWKDYDKNGTLECFVFARKQQETGDVWFVSEDGNATMLMENVVLMGARLYDCRDEKFIFLDYRDGENGCSRVYMVENGLPAEKTLPGEYAFVEYGRIPVSTFTVSREDTEKNPLAEGIVTRECRYQDGTFSYFEQKELTEEEVKAFDNGEMMLSEMADLYEGARIRYFLGENQVLMMQAEIPLEEGGVRYVWNSYRIRRNRLIFENSGEGLAFS